MQNEMLIVEDLTLLLLDDETGTPSAAGTLHYTLGGALLVELALLGRVETEEGTWLQGLKVRAAGDGPLPDPLLQAAFDQVARKPRGVQATLLDIGAGLLKPVTERLIERGHIRRESRKVLGLFNVTRTPAGDTGHEAELRQRVRAALVDGVEPDARTAAVIALVSASGALPSLRPALAWSSTVARRAKEFEQGNWGAKAVGDAVSQAAAAIAAASAVTAVTVITTTGS